MYYTASCSMGKDSLAMVLKLIEESYPLDEVLYFDMGSAEFDCIHNNSDKLGEYLKSKKIKYTVLKIEPSFEYYMYEKPVQKRSGAIQNGYMWCGSGKCRLGTHLKLSAIEKYLAEIPDEVTQYIGISADEAARAERGKANNRTHTIKKYPLLEDWCMTERECLAYCRAHGWHWIEEGHDLYDLLNRISCFCCGNKNLSELYAMYKYLPNYFKRLEDMQRKIPTMPYRRNGETVFDLRERFEKRLEEENAQPDIFTIFKEEQE